MSDGTDLAAIREERFTTHAERVVAERAHAAKERARIAAGEPKIGHWARKPSAAALEALYDFDLRERPWGYGKGEQEIEAEVERRVAEWEATR